jgi:hypothetical protein
MITFQLSLDRRFGIISFLRSSGSARLHSPGQRRGPEALGLPTQRANSDI